MSRALKQHIRISRTLSAKHKLAICVRDPVGLRAHLREHIDTMKPLGFNAHALGRLASRSLPLLLASPQALEAHYSMLRDVFGPCADDLATSLAATNIKPNCLPAVAHDAVHAAAGAYTKLAISCLHKAMLSGPAAILIFTREGLEAHLQTLVDVGLFASGAEARTGCMQRHGGLLVSHTLKWLAQRKAAALVAGCCQEDARAVCARTSSMQVVLRSLLLWQRARCVSLCSTNVTFSCTVIDRARNARVSV